MNEEKNYDRKCLREGGSRRIHMPATVPSTVRRATMPTLPRQDQLYDIVDGAAVHAGSHAHFSEEGGPAKQAAGPRHAPRGTVLVHGGRAGDFNGATLLSTRFVVHRVPRINESKHVHAPFTAASQPESSVRSDRRGRRGGAVFGAEEENKLSAEHLASINNLLDKAVYQRPHPDPQRTRESFRSKERRVPYWANEHYPELPATIAGRERRRSPRIYSYIAKCMDGKAPAVDNFLLSLAICGKCMCCVRTRIPPH